jgi:hypothetical protein
MLREVDDEVGMCGLVCAPLRRQNAEKATMDATFKMECQIGAKIKMISDHFY